MTNSIIGVVMMLIGVFTFVLSLNFRDEKKHTKRWLYFLTSIICFTPFVFVAFINPYYYGFGKAKSFDNALIQNNTLLVTDFFQLGKRRKKTTKNGRLHAIDLTTGKKKFRTFSGYAFEKIIPFNDKYVVLKRVNDFIGYNIKNGKEKFSINIKIIENHIPALNNLVSFCSINTGDSLFSIFTKQGESFKVNPLNFKLTKDSINLDPSKDIHAFGYEKEKDPGDFSNELAGFKLSYDVKKKLLNQKNEILNENLFFIDGGLLTYFPKQEILTLISYNSTDHTEFYITGVNKNGTLIWQLKETESLGIHGKFSFALAHHDKLIVLIGGNALAFDSKNGKICWKTTL